MNNNNYIQDLKELYKQEYGKTMTDKQAESEFLKLAELYTIVYAEPEAWQRFPINGTTDSGK